MRQLSTIQLISGVSLLTLITPIQADTILTYSETHTLESQERSGERTYEAKIWLGDDRSRYEDHHQTFLLDAAANQLFVVIPDEKFYSLFSHPLWIEDLATTESDKRALVFFMARLFEIADTGVTEKIGTWTARKYNIVSHDRRSKVTAWLSDEPPLDAERIRRLFLDYMAFRPPDRPWLEKLFAFDGIPVLLEHVMSFEANIRLGARTRTWTLRLLSVEERDVPPELYRVPADFEERPLDLSRYFGAKGF